jgi:transposase InsO family protein
LPEAIYRNEIALAIIDVPNVAWAGDFTYIKYRGSFIYLATIIDVCTREVIGSAISRWHSRHLVKSALLDAIKKRGQLPQYFHSDQGSEYRSEEHADYLQKLGVMVSMSRKSSPWQNGRQESFFSQFKLELGNPNRFEFEEKLSEKVGTCHSHVLVNRTHFIPSVH